MVKMAIATAKKNGCKGICGQAPSDYPEFAQFLVELGIDSLNLCLASIVAEVEVGNILDPCR